MQKYCGWDWNSVSAHLPFCQVRVRLKGGFLEIYLTTCFGVRNFGNTSAMMYLLCFLTQLLCFLQLNYLHIDEYIWQKLCCSDWNKGLARLPCCYSAGPLKRDFLDIYLTTYFGVPNFGNTQVMRIILFWKVSKCNTNFKTSLKIKKKFVVSGINASELVAKNSLY